MRVPMRVMASPPVRSGMVLAGLFGWLLAFPMFGPLLFSRTGEAAPALGLVFIFAHGAGLLTLHRLPFAGATRRLLARGAGAVAAGLTLLFGVGPAVAPWLSFGLMAVIGMAAAVLVLAWVDDWMGCGNRLAALAAAMAGANVVVALVALPSGVPSVLWVLVTAAMALGCSLWLAGPGDGPWGGQREATPSDRVHAPGPPPLGGAVIAVAAFALADYFVGGIWYNILAASVGSVGPWQSAVEALTYALAAGLLFLRVRRRHSGELALFSLSLLGMGLLVASSGSGGLGAVFVFRATLLAGLAAGDLFFWDQLGHLGLVYGGRRTLGIGLGGSLLLIGLANLGAALAAPEQGGAGRLFLLVGAALLFLVIPVVFRYAAAGEEADAMASTTAADRAAEPHTSVPGVKRPSLPEVPPNLTPAERQVYAWLVAGATDQEIAAALVISTHTVKFHVRNVLHKAGAANRKDLLSRLVAESVAATEER